MALDCNTRASTNFLGTLKYIKGLHQGIICHPISKMPRMLIVWSASIRSGSANDHMSGALNVCMFYKPVIVPIYSGSYRLFILKALRWFMNFIGHLVLKYILGMMCTFLCCPFHAEKGCVIPVFLSHMFCLMYFTPCWGLCFTNRNRTIL